MARQPGEIQDVLGQHDVAGPSDPGQKVASPATMVQVYTRPADLESPADPESPDPHSRAATLAELLDGLTVQNNAIFDAAKAAGADLVKPILHDYIRCARDSLALCRALHDAVADMQRYEKDVRVVLEKIDQALRAQSEQDLSQCDSDSVSFRSKFARIDAPHVPDVEDTSEELKSLVEKFTTLDNACSDATAKLETRLQSVKEQRSHKLVDLIKGGLGLLVYVAVVVATAVPSLGIGPALIAPVGGLGFCVSQGLRTVKAAAKAKQLQEEYDVLQRDLGTAKTMQKDANVCFWEVVLVEHCLGLCRLRVEGVHEAVEGVQGDSRTRDDSRPVVQLDRDLLEGRIRSLHMSTQDLESAVNKYQSSVLYLTNQLTCLVKDDNLVEANKKRPFCGLLSCLG